MKLFLCIATLLAAGALAAPGDVLQLTTGKQVTGQVLSYRGMAFEVRTPDGAIAKHPQPTVKRIDFEGTSAVIQTRTRGTLKGQLKSYEASAFALVNDQGQTETVTLTLIKDITFGGGSSKKVDTITTGARVDVKANLAPGSVTIVDFYADWCGPCRAIGPTLERLAKNDPDVFLRKVNIVKWGSPVAQQYQIDSIPHMEVYDRRGRLTGTVKGANPDEIQQLVERAKQSK